MELLPLLLEALALGPTLWWVFFLFEMQNWNWDLCKRFWSVEVFSVTGRIPWETCSQMQQDEEKPISAEELGQINKIPYLKNGNLGLSFNIGLQFKYIFLVQELQANKFTLILIHFCWYLNVSARRNPIPSRRHSHNLADNRSQKQSLIAEEPFFLLPQWRKQSDWISANRTLIFQFPHGLMKRTKWQPTHTLSCVTGEKS